MGYHDATFEPAEGHRHAVLSGLTGHRRVRRTYGQAAFAAAVENGLMPDELGQVLAGRSVVEAFPVGGNESVADYAYRAVAEMMVAYLRHDAA